MINENGLGYCYENATDEVDFEQLCMYLEKQYKAFVQNGKCILAPNETLVKQFEYKNIALRTDEIIKSLLK